MTGDESNIDTLVSHLEAEEACLTEMVRLLEDEADALRHMRHAELAGYSESKLAVAETHQALVCQRNACIATIAPSETRPHNLTDVRRVLGDEGDTLAGNQRRLRALCDRVGRLRAHNMALADMGRRRVDESLRALRARRNPVYRGDGRLHAQTPAQRGRGRV